MTQLVVSRLGHTWLIDMDGTLIRHNGHLDGLDEVLPGVLEFWALIPDEDIVILLSARDRQFAELTLDFFRAQGMRYDHAIFGLPTGERILINDCKPSGLLTAFAVNMQRDQGLGGLGLTIDPNI